MGASGVRVGRITDADGLHALTAEWTALADLGAASLRAEEDPFAPFDAELSRAMHATRYRKGWKHS